MSRKRARKMMWSNISNAADKSSEVKNAADKSNGVKIDTRPSQHRQEGSFWHLEELSPYCDAHGTQTGRSQRDCRPTDGREADAVQPSPAVWKERAGLTQADSLFAYLFVFYYLTSLYFFASYQQAIPAPYKGQYTTTKHQQYAPGHEVVAKDNSQSEKSHQPHVKLWKLGQSQWSLKHYTPTLGSLNKCL